MILIVTLAVAFDTPFTKDKWPFNPLYIIVTGNIIILFLIAFVDIVTTLIRFYLAFNWNFGGSEPSSVGSTLRDIHSRTSIYFQAFIKLLVLI